MKNKINTHNDIQEIIKPILALDLSLNDLRLLASQLLDEAAIIEEEIEYQKRKGEE